MRPATGEDIVYSLWKHKVQRKLQSGSMPDIDSNIANVEAFEAAGKEIFGEFGCLPMIAYGKTKKLSAFKLLARARNLDFEIANEVSKQIATYELERKHKIENNQDDPDYDVDDYIDINDYVDESYHQLIDDSAQYQNIVVTLAPHPCAHLVYHKDLREEIGVIRLKAKTGNKEPQYCAYIDGATADAFGYVKSDLLRVDVVKIINETFRVIGRPVLSADELVEAVKDDPKIWKLYEDGFTLGLNQCEKPRTTERVMRFKPRNTVELAAFVAAIRPGAKSLVDDYVTRTLHNYGIPSMDKLLALNGATGVTGHSSFLFYDEQIMVLAQAAGISPADANVLTKAIKKKKHDKVAAFKERFVPGFIAYLKDKEHTDDALAEKTANDVWTVILNSASYLFNASHAYAMCLDSLYGAYLKLHYPYEFYSVMLRLYSDKGNKEKIALIVQEMKKYRGIQMIAGKFRQDNRDWYVDKSNATISQSLSSIKFISSQVSQELYEIRDMPFDTFTDLLRHLQMNTSLNTRQIKTLIRLNYFSEFGSNGKLMDIFNEFYEGKNKLTKTVKSYEKRLAAMREYEKNRPEKTLSIYEVLPEEFNVLEMCRSIDIAAQPGTYFVTAVEKKYSAWVTAYNLRTGRTGRLKVAMKTFEEKPLEVCQFFVIDQWKQQNKCVYKDGKRKPIPNEYENIMLAYHIIYTPAKEK